MLLLMRRLGEIIRINEKIILQVKEIHAESVTFSLEDLDENEKKDETMKIKVNTQHKTKKDS
jgi:sRNA-binding carbon storage regulator CsrA